MKNYAYISLIATNNYIGAAVTMMEAWRRTKSQYPFYLMVTENISKENREILEVLGYKLIDIQEWRPQVYDEQRVNFTNDEFLVWHGTGGEDKGWSHVFSKILCWNLTQFDKVCFLDIDILLFHNIDDVFELMTPAWLGPDVNGFSASQIFVLEPNKTMYQKILQFAANYPGKADTLFTDEDLLHDFFKEEVEFNKSIPLTYIYNWDRCCTDYTFIEDSFNIRGIHMTGTFKPWLNDTNYVENFTQSWYPARFIWYYYISIYNLGITRLNQKGYHLPYIE